MDLKNRFILPLTCIFIFEAFNVAGVYGISNDETRLLGKLLADYNTMARPVLDSNQPLHINVSFQIQFFNDLIWKDSHLTWKPEEYGGLRELTLPPYAIWIPDGYFENNLFSELFAQRVEELKYIRTESDGRVTFDCSGLLETRCSLDMTYFPFDKHRCSIRFLSFSSDASRVMFHVHQKFRPYREDAFNNQYMIERYCFNSYFEQSVLNSSTVEVALQIKRRPSVLVWSLLLPLNLLSVLLTSYLGTASEGDCFWGSAPNNITNQFWSVALLVFAMPAEGGEKVALAITVLLSFMVFQSTVDEMMPDNTNTLPVVALFIGSVTIMTTLSLFVTVLVTKLHFKEVNDPVSSCLLRFVPRRMLVSTRSRTSSISGPSDDTLSNHGLFGQDVVSRAGKDKKRLQLKEENPKVEWKELGKLIDKICLCVFSAAYITLAVGTLFASLYNHLEADDGRCTPWKEAI